MRVEQRGLDSHPLKASMLSGVLEESDSSRRRKGSRRARLAAAVGPTTSRHDEHAPDSHSDGADASSSGRKTSSSS
eukprot:CAMPEP_0168601924 /NCGR_PEP_ID=MMETSP0420-20121227/13735_1 /TAXON_ID=498008 /ORGANISM="Pessonella sp." /LENGTH=75 /DNA_ID=CAMNT_0008640431 /DNA_START=1 /DNA_END=224 /DNA_ORIENTATION=-